MTEAAYYTEVHNINGDGENAGVVYCEMQVRRAIAVDLYGWRMSAFFFLHSNQEWNETSSRDAKILLDRSWTSSECDKTSVQFLWENLTHADLRQFPFSRQRIMYPENSGYRYETGGLMLNLRSLGAEKSTYCRLYYKRPVVRSWNQSWRMPAALLFIFFHQTLSIVRQVWWLRYMPWMNDLCIMCVVVT